MSRHWFWNGDSVWGVSSCDIYDLWIHFSWLRWDNYLLNYTFQFWIVCNILCYNLHCSNSKMHLLLHLGFNELNDPSSVLFLHWIIPSLFEIAGTHHYWLNKSAKNKQFFESDRIFLVLAARIFECGIMFQKLKTIQKRYREDIISSPPKLDTIRDGFFVIIKMYFGGRFPNIIVMGLKPIHSSDIVNLIQLLMTENITFPILLSQQTFPQVR